MTEFPRTLKSSFVLLALMVGLIVPSSSVAAPHDRGPCSTQAQSVTDLVGVSCKKAKRVARKATRQLTGLPDCRGDATRTFRSWKVSGAGKPGDLVVTVFISGPRSFILSGGGTC